MSRRKSIENIINEIYKYKNDNFLSLNNLSNETNIPIPTLFRMFRGVGKLSLRNSKRLYAWFEGKKHN